MRILVVTSGSQHSVAAVCLGARLLQHVQKAKQEAKLVVLTVIRRESERACTEDILAQASAIFPDGTTNLEPKVRVGNPVEEIIQEARVGKFDLVVMGWRPATPLLGPMLGSIPERTLGLSSCPIVLAKGNIGDLKRILICDSGVLTDSLPERVLACLADLLTDDCVVSVLHVMSQISAGPGVRGWQLRASAEELIKAHTPEGEILARDMQILGEAKVHAHPKIRHGLVVDEIMAEAREGNYGLIIIGAHQVEGGEHFLLDDLAHQIITHADRPVVVVQ
jgi:nucleotide-binding universal stress UspA family protein